MKSSLLKKFMLFTFLLGTFSSVQESKAWVPFIILPTAKAIAGFIMVMVIKKVVHGDGPQTPPTPPTQ